MKIVPVQDVAVLVSSQIKESLSFEDFNNRVQSFGKGKVSMNSFNPSQEQIKMYTSPEISIDVIKSVAVVSAEDSPSCQCHVDIDQSVFAAKRLLPTLFEFVKSPTPQPHQSVSPSTDASYDDISSDLLAAPARMLFLEPTLMSGESRTVSKSSRTSLLSTSVQQFTTSLRRQSLNDANKVVAFLNENIPLHHLMANTRLDAVLKNVRQHNSKFGTFDQFSHLVTAEFVNIDLGQSTSDVPLLVAVRASVSEVKQGVMDLVSAWRNRGKNPTSSECTTNDKVNDQYSKWGSSDKYENVSISLHSLQLGSALLVLARKQDQADYDQEAVHFICESYNQKRSAHSTSFVMYILKLKNYN